MDIKKIIKKVLSEQAGISQEVREWSDILYDEILNNPEEHYNGGRIIVDVYEKLPVDYFVIDFYDTFTGYDVQKSGYDSNGYYCVLIYIQPRLIHSGYNLKSTLNHELKHAYQDFKRVSTGHPNLDNTSESKTFYTGDFINYLNKGKTTPISQILKYYYYTSNMERDAFLENVYDNYLNYENIIRTILSTDFNRFLTNSLTSEWNEVIQQDIPILKKYKTPEEFVNKSSVYLKNKAQKILRKIQKMNYIHGNL